MKNVKFTIFTFGCKVNQYDSSVLSWFLKNNGLKMVRENADIIIINSCSVTKSAIHKAHRLLNKARQENAKAKILLMGCWPEVYKLKKDDIKTDLLWGTGKLEALAKKIVKLFDLRSNTKKLPVPFAATDRVRYFLKIEDGCEQFCSYCVIPYARGTIKSRPVKDIMAEIEQAANLGYREIVLTGIHLGLYGKDIEVEKINLAGLLKKINIDKTRIRLSSIEVNEIDDEIIKIFKNNKIFCRHFHIPLQAGSDTILKLMNRPYNTKMFAAKIKKIRQSLPLVGITTDVIIGFPGEGEREFRETMEFIKKMKFSRLHVFPYSEHEMAPAAKLKNKVAANVILERTKKMRDLNYKLENSFKKLFRGR